MLSVKSLTVQSYDFQLLNVQWEFNITSENIADYHLDIYRSEVPEPVTMFSGVGEEISSSAYSYTDTSISGINLHQFRTWYYRIKIIETAVPLNYEWSDPAHFEYVADAQAKIMLRHKSIGLKRYGRLVKIIKKRIDGQKCTNCWDSILGRIIDDSCEICYGTGIVLGYYDPIEIYAALNNKPKQNQITPFGVWQQNDALMDILNYPVLSPDDVIIDQTNKRWKVKLIASFSKGSSLISQRCVITLIGKDNPIYELNNENL